MWYPMNLRKVTEYALCQVHNKKKTSHIKHNVFYVLCGGLCDADHQNPVSTFSYWTHPFTWYQYGKPTEFRDR